MKLKPCPFCGGLAYPMHHPSTDKDDEYYLVMCMYCFARTVGETVGETNEAWNRRATEKERPHEGDQIKNF